MQKNNIIAVIVTHNRVDKLKKCIESLSKQVYKEFDIIVVDNASTDDTQVFLSENKIKNICMKKNEGGAGGFNYGIKYSVKHGYSYCWIMDDDCMPTENALLELVNAKNDLKDLEFGFLASKVLWTDGKLCEMNRPKLIKNNKPSKYKRVSQSTFVSMFIPVVVVKKYGLPIKDFFIWGDDIEYTRRIAVRNKVPSFLVENSIVIHDTETNDGSDISKDKIDKLKRYNYAYRNENYLYRQEGIKGLFFYILKCIYNCIKIIIYSKDKRAVRIFTILKNLVLGLFFNPTIEYPE